MYSILLVPVAIVRFIEFGGGNVPFAATIVADSLFNLQGKSPLMGTYLESDLSLCRRVERDLALRHAQKSPCINWYSRSGSGTPQSHQHVFTGGSRHHSLYARIGSIWDITSLDASLITPRTSRPRCTCSLDSRCEPRRKRRFCQLPNPPVSQRDGCSVICEKYPK